MKKFSQGFWDKKKLKKMGEKKIKEKKEKAPPEKFWSALVKIYFDFYRRHFRDNDGYSLSPNWNDGRRGLESKGLKEIIIRIRTIWEEKGNEWTEQAASQELWKFFEKAYQNPFHRKSFMCCLMNKYKDMIIVSDIVNPLSKKIITAWYEFFPEKKDYERDLKGSEIIIGYLKQQFLQNNLEFTDAAVMSSVKIIFTHVKTDQFWAKKSLVSIGYNISEFILKIKSKQNGTANIRGTGEKPIATIQPKGGFGKL